MKLKSGTLLWPDQNKNSIKKVKYPKLNKNISCDVVIVGGGIIGSITAYHLSKKNLKVVLVEKAEIAGGSTSASTALLMYQLDTNLSDLIRKIGADLAVRAYKVSRASVVSIKKLINKLDIDCRYKKKKIIYLASTKKDVPVLKKEYRALSKYGFKVDYLNKEKLKKEFGIDKEAAIRTYGSAEVDPYILTYELVRQAYNRDVKVYEHTEVVSYTEEVVRKNKVKVLKTSKGNTISAKKVIFAMGYESQFYLKKTIVDLMSSYVIASAPIPKLKNHWLKDYIVWETSRPYLYIRTSPDDRIIVGGEDQDVVAPKKRDVLLPSKSRKLKDKFQKLVTNLPISVDYRWAGTFGETKDGLGFVGCPKEFKDIYFALGFGGNGITFGIIAAEMLSRLVLGKRNKDQKLFSFNR